MDDDLFKFTIEITSAKHISYSQDISKTMEESAQARGTGISRRSPELIAHYIENGDAVIAFDAPGNWAGFCYLAVYGNRAFISNSGLIIAPRFREHGLARQLKQQLFNYCRVKYPGASIFGITTSPAVMKINTELGFYPTAFSDLPQDETFWKGCESCVNHDILKRTSRKFCLCTAMRFDPVHAIKDCTP